MNRNRGSVPARERQVCTQKEQDTSGQWRLFSSCIDLSLSRYLRCPSFLIKVRTANTELDSRLQPSVPFSHIYVLVSLAVCPLQSVAFHLICSFLSLSLSLSIHLLIHRSTSFDLYFALSISTNLPLYISRPIYSSIDPSVYIFGSIFLPNYIPQALFLFHRSIHLSLYHIDRSISLSMSHNLSLNLIIYLPLNPSISVYVC